MDSFLTICTALGLALAVALILAALLPRWRPLAGALLGAAAAGAWLQSASDPIWPAVAIGLVSAWACLELGTFFDGVARREARASGTDGAPVAERTPALVALAFVCVLVVAVAAVFLPPSSLLVALVVAAISMRRRRAATAKHAGLRILR